MNKRIDKPRAGRRLTADDTASESQIERFMKANRASFAAKLRAGKRALDRGEAAGLEPLSQLLREARKRAKSAD
jgi:hypothetical protein